jgi:hypothetical protein
MRQFKTPKPASQQQVVRRRYVPRKHALQFRCEWAVYPVGGDSSVCYVTDKMRARLVSLALTRFLNTTEGDEWLKRNAS